MKSNIKISNEEKRYDPAFVSFAVMSIGVFSVAVIRFIIILISYLI